MGSGHPTTADEQGGQINLTSISNTIRNSPLLCYWRSNLQGITSCCNHTIFLS
ncbi:hypothetical protein T4B_591 [Trichinella pseudospiralis]|uniref:Uncharacterized protein n=1 Tax=Trichinella pseudospiralis TaxID=6337 RepID=A0A0V1GCD1_TRIPS|nr:hypothetical protein T4B_591 [Trichinella pseudospiralis]